MTKIRSYWLTLAVCTIFASCSASLQVNHAAKDSVSAKSQLKKKQMPQLVDFASKQLKAPYRWGGNTPKGFDCSGFTSYCYAQLGAPIPRTAIEQSQIGKRIRSKKAKTGDLIFFKGSDKKQKKVAHVGIVVSGRKKKIKFIHAASSGVRMSQLSEEYYSKRFKTIRRIRK